jgi:uncharacterized protein involved in cysteine biosynthesis
MENLRLDKNNLRKFGVTMGAAFFVITLLVFIKHKHSILPTSVIALIFLSCAFTAPNILKPIYIFWMKLANILSWINTRLILLVIFYLIFTPIGLGMRLFGIDLLGRKIEKQKRSYWRKRESQRYSPLNYERQF